MHPTLLDNTLTSSNAPALSTQFVRTSGAPNALGFAQVMQAFETEQQSLSAAQADAQSTQDDQLIEQSQDSTDIENDDAGDQADQDQQSQSGQNDDQENAGEPTGQANQGELDATGASSSSNVNNAQGQVGDTQVDNLQSQLQVGAEVSVGDESAFRLLENQSDQARLSIKGVVRSITHAADANLTANAVNTRLGQNQTNLETGLQTQTQPESTTPNQSLQATAAQSPLEPTQSQVPDLPAGSPQVIQANTQPVQYAQAHARGDAQQAQQTQTSPEFGQAQSQRGDVASVVSQAVSSVQTHESSAISLSARQLAGIARTQNQQVIRTVTSIDSGNVGNQPSSTNSGSQVGKMQPTEMLSETRRASVLAQVQRGLASLLRSGDNEMTLKLTPGHLGEIRIQIKTQGDQLSVRFETSSEQATQYLNASVNDLTSNLLAKGMNIQSIEINHEAPQESANTNEQGSTDPDAQSSDHQQGQSDQGTSHQRANEAFDDDLQSNEPEEIWTELGLDAIA